MSNIDLVPANILLQDSGVSVIDYEWTFRFPIPCNFILYRMIHYYLESDGKRAVLRDLDFYKKAGISEKELEIYAEMERNFQKYMEGGHVPLREMYDEVSPGKVDIMAYYDRIRAACATRRLQVFYDRGNDFSEADSDIYPMTKHGIDFGITVPQNVRRLRLDPGEAAGGLVLKKLVFENGKEADFSSNGFPIGNGRYYFGGGDPQFVIESLPKNTGKLYIEIEVMKESEAQEAFWMSFSRISAEKDKEIQKLKHQISEMKNTKAWKLYRSIKKK